MDNGVPHAVGGHNAISRPEKRPPRAATAQQTPSVNCAIELGRTATVALTSSSRRSCYHFLGRDGTGGENVALEVAVVPLGCADVGVAELPLDVHQRVAGGEPRRRGRVAERVERHVAKRRRPPGPACANHARRWFGRAARPTPALSQRPLLRRLDRTGITNNAAAAAVSGSELGATRDLVAQHRAESGSDLDRAEAVRLRRAHGAALARAVDDDRPASLRASCRSLARRARASLIRVPVPISSAASGL